MRKERLREEIQQQQLQETAQQTNTDIPYRVDRQSAI